MAGLLDEPYIGYPQLARRRAVPNTDVETSKGLLRGISYYPYDLLGAPIDLMNMAITPLGMGSKTPVMGSEYLQGLAQKAGLSLPKTDSSSENIGRILSSIINPAAGARAVGKVIDPAMQAAAPVGRAVGEQAYRMTEDLLQNQGLMPSITAYHGTPYNIQGGFDIGKVGTGEGAQAYGHGMYFAENPKVAEGYKEALSTFKTTLDGIPITPDNPKFSAVMTVGSQGYKKALEQAELAKKSGFVKPEIADQEIANIKALKDAKIESVKQGNLYKVDIPDQYIPNMLDWDKPLSEQSQEIKDALSNIPHRGKDWTFKTTIETLDAAPYLRDDVTLNPTGSEIYSLLGDAMMVGNKAPGQINASKKLNELGIKGIRYLDEGSREKKQGTSNFVVFDPKDVKILEKNSQKVESLLD